MKVFKPSSLVAVLLLSIAGVIALPLAIEPSTAFRTSVGLWWALTATFAAAPALWAMARDLREVRYARLRIIQANLGATAGVAFLYGVV